MLKQEAVIVLSDGVPRKARFDLNTLVLIEDALGVPWDQWPDKKITPLKMFRAALWAVLFEDSVQRIDPRWTPQQAFSLVTQENLAKVQSQIDSLRKAFWQGTDSPETSGDAQSSPATQDLGTGEKL